MNDFMKGKLIFASTCFVMMFCCSSIFSQDAVHNCLEVREGYILVVSRKMESYEQVQIVDYFFIDTLPELSKEMTPGTLLSMDYELVSRNYYVNKHLIRLMMMGSTLNEWFVTSQNLKSSFQTKRFEFKSYVVLLASFSKTVDISEYIRREGTSHSSSYFSVTNEYNNLKINVLYPELIYPVKINKE